LEPTTELVRRRAASAGRGVEIVARLCQGAFDALMSGDAAAHDARVTEALAALSAEVDVIVLAQASMARVADQIPPEKWRVPILASPAIAIDHIASVLA
jgi:hypothetical protein